MTTSSDPIAQQSCAHQHPAKAQAQLQAGSDGKIPKSKPSERNGKLHGVCQTAKRSALIRLSAQSIDFETPKDCRTDEIATTLDAASETSRKQKVSERVTSASSKKSLKPVRGHKRNAGEELVTSQPKQKRMKNFRCKAVTDGIEVGKQVKKPRGPSANSAKSDVTATIREEREKHITQSTSFIASSDVLIKRLAGSQKPANIANTPFKKPVLPTQPTQNLTTPTKPRTKVVEKKRLRTPKDAPRWSWDEVYHPSSSPSVTYDADATVDWLQTGSDQEVLSSNSKPVPASPNAESKAISGHADHDDMVFEKWTGDSQTERVNPFLQRRGDRKPTSFLRRLTGEDQANEQVDGSLGSPHGVQITVNGSTSLAAGAPQKSRTIAAHMPLQKSKLSAPQDKTEASKLIQIEGLNMYTVLQTSALSRKEHKPHQSPRHTQCTQVKRVFPQNIISPSRQDSNNEEDYNYTKRLVPILLIVKKKQELVY